jgi:hypothetical protein
MLTETAYVTAMTCYLLSALLLLWLGNRWLLGSWSLAARLLVTLPLAALLLTPAYVQPDAKTFAPALLAAALGWLADGAQGAEHALRPLLVITGAAAILGVVSAVLALLLGRRAASRAAAAQS